MRTQRLWWMVCGAAVTTWYQVLLDTGNWGLAISHLVVNGLSLLLFYSGWWLWQHFEIRERQQDHKEVEG